MEPPPILCTIVGDKHPFHGVPTCRLASPAIKRLRLRVGDLAVVELGEGGRLMVMKIDVNTDPNAFHADPPCAYICDRLLDAFRIQTGDQLLLHHIRHGLNRAPKASKVLLRLDGSVAMSSCPLQFFQTFLTSFCRRMKALPTIAAAPSHSPPSIAPPRQGELVPSTESVSLEFDAEAMSEPCLDPTPVAKVLCQGLAVVNGGFMVIDTMGQLIGFQAEGMESGLPFMIAPSTQISIQVPMNAVPKALLPPKQQPTPVPLALGSPVQRPPPTDAKEVTLAFTKFLTQTYQKWQSVIEPQLTDRCYGDILRQLSFLICTLTSNSTFCRSILDRHYAMFDFPCIHGALIYGISGVGKTTLAKDLCRILTSFPRNSLKSKIQHNFPAFTPYFWDVPMDFFGHGSQITIATIGKSIRSAFREAIRHAPSILVLDNLDAVTSSSMADTTCRVGMAELLSQMDKLQRHQPVSPVFVIGLASTCNMDRSMFSVGRFEKTYELTIPTTEMRTRILDDLIPHRWTDTLAFESMDGKISHPREYIIERFANNTHGCLPVDLKQLVTKVVTCKAAQDVAVSVNVEGLACVEGTLEQPKLQENFTDQDFWTALDHLQPTLAASSTGTVTSVGSIGEGSRSQYRFRDLVTMDDKLQIVMKHILLPLERHALLSTMGIRVPKGLLLYGPSGTGKTHLARSLTSQEMAININFVPVNSADIVHKVVGESEKAIRALFERARACSPCVLFMDNFEALASKRRTDGTASALDRTLSTLLIEMDGIQAHPDAKVVLIAATNDKSLLDPAIMRSGRLDIHIEFELPTESERAILLRHFLAKTKHDPTLDVDSLAKQMKGYSPADIQETVHTAALLAVREFVLETEANKNTTDLTDLNMSPGPACDTSLSLASDLSVSLKHLHGAMKK